MRKWFALGAAVLTEGTATVTLKAAQQAPGWYALTAAGYLGAFCLFLLCLRLGMRIGVAYGIRWAGVVTVTALVSAAVYDEAVTLAIGAGIVLSVAGILAIELGSRSARGRSQRGHIGNWALLIRAVVTETRATTSSRAAERLTGSLRAIPIAGGYVLAILMMSLALRRELALGVSYAIWASGGVVLTAVLARVISHKPLGRVMVAGILLVAAAVLTLVGLDDHWY